MSVFQILSVDQADKEKNQHEAVLGKLLWVLEHIYKGLVLKDIELPKRVHRIVLISHCELHPSTLETNISNINYCHFIVRLNCGHEVTMAT